MADYKKFEGKRVRLVRNLDKPNENGESAVEMEGKVEVVNEQGILIKPKGKVQLDLLTNDEIEEIDFAPEKAKVLKARQLKPIEHGQARNHLLERHGWTLDKANAITEAEALELHGEIDHVAENLGHVHVSKEESERDQAVAQAEADEAADAEEGAA